MEWISTKEKSIPVLCFVIAGLFLHSGIFDYKLICIDDCGDIRDMNWEYDGAWEVDDYTHWMPLPAPPEEKQ